MQPLPVLEVLGLHLRHLATGEVKHLLAEQLEDDHVVLTEALAGAAGAHDVADEGGPVFGPLLLQDLKAEELRVSRRRAEASRRQTKTFIYLYEDHVEL